MPKKIKTPEDIENLRTYMREYARQRRKDPTYREKINRDRRTRRHEDPAYAEKINAQNRASRVHTPGRVIYMRERSAKNRQFMDLLKLERGCYDCGGMFAPEALDWDHLPGKEKLFSIGNSGPQRSVESCIDEINKCQLVCSNCHRVRTRNRKQEKRDKVCPV